MKYEEGASIARGGEEQLDQKLDMELDVKTPREEREACARGGDVPAGARTGQPAAPPGRPVPGPENKDSADIITWREFEALRNEMRREFRTQDDELKGKVEEISQKLNTANETVKTLMTHLVVVTVLVVGLHLAAMVVDRMKKMDWGLIFPRSFQKTGRYEVGPRGDATLGGAPGLAARPVVWVPRDAPTCPSAYLKPSSETPSTESHDMENLPDAAAANPISGFRRSPPAPAGEGIISRRALHHHDRLRIDV
ncbi:hypothetical protein QYE76_071067 [Lolium multiflorum]|uniref:Uncharacterized protein n=1 Tax=Lolium multiflorum TaxID=4521 RepID=A0AAD8SLD2_LOLMU|nr:hypothetical protein QYE76_071067 [Lolium multiflorum]